MNVHVAVVTGISSGIGKAIGQMLLDRGYRVHGISRRTVAYDGDYIHHKVDLCDVSQLQSGCARILEKDRKIDLLVNAAGTGFFAPHEELSSQKIEQMVTLNLTVPMLMAREFLRTLKSSDGLFVTISSTSSRKPSRSGATYAATKAGIDKFSETLFIEGRKQGLRTLNIVPDIVNTPFFDQLTFRPDHDPLSYLEPDCIAKALEDMLFKTRAGTVVTEIVIQPQFLKINKKPQQDKSNES